MCCVLCVVCVVCVINCVLSATKIDQIFLRDLFLTFSGNLFFRNDATGEFGRGAPTCRGVPTARSSYFFKVVVVVVVVVVGGGGGGGGGGYQFAVHFDRKEK